MHEMVLKQSIRLALGHRQQQALTILQMPLDELCEYIEDMLLVNPFLERKAEIRGTYSEEFYELYSGDERRQYAAIKVRDYLEQQISELTLGKLQKERILSLIDLMDTRGYLTCSAGDYAKMMEIPQEMAEEDIALMQSLDPPGIGARNLSECLCLQLQRAQIESEYIYKIAREHIEDVATGNIAKIAMLTEIPKEMVTVAIAVLQRMNPIPLNGFADEKDTIYIQPDVVVSVEGDVTNIRCIGDERTTLKLNREYINDVLSQNDDDETKAWIEERVKDANNLIYSIEARKNTMMSCAEIIVSRQNSFFMGGERKPLTMAEISEIIGVNISTVSRALRGKYIQCQHGVLPMSYFCVRYVSGDHTSESIKERIRQIVEEENKNAPLSDGAIAVLLNKEGVNISRRTVAKYRKEILLPSMRWRTELNNKDENKGEGSI